jgi:hypothetical protein
MGCNKDKLSMNIQVPDIPKNLEYSNGSSGFEGISKTNEKGRLII